jgi:predicted site-specific integrase-resolvase
MKVSISEASRILGVAQVTLRRWEHEGKMHPERTKGGQRRYDLDQLIGRKVAEHSCERITIAYARVSSHDQKEDLARQAQALSDFCTCHGWIHEVIRDLGSGMNYHKKGLRMLLNRITAGEVERLVIPHKDRLLRFGAELVFALCEQFRTEVVIINHSGEVSYEEELTQDVLEIITVFSARLYGSRSHKNKRLIEQMKEVAREG